jgi:gas vesicle protein GvpL/GvpF
MSWLLAITDGEPSPDLAVTTIRACGLSAILVAEDGAAPSATTFLEHAAIVRSLLASCDALLPVRAGSRVSDEHEARAVLHERAVEFRNGLDRVRGAVEMGVRCAPVPAAREVGEASNGREYLSARTGAWRWVDRTVADIAGFTAIPGVRDHVLLSETPAAVKASVLVDARDAHTLRAAIDRMRQRSAGQVVCSGPYPPYSFARVRTEDADDQHIEF